MYMVVTMHFQDAVAGAALRRVHRRYSRELIIDVEQMCNVIKGVFAIICSTPE